MYSTTLPCTRHCSKCFTNISSITLVILPLLCIFINTKPCPLPQAVVNSCGQAAAWGPVLLAKSLAPSRAGPGSGGWHTSHLSTCLQLRLPHQLTEKHVTQPPLPCLWEVLDLGNLFPQSSPSVRMGCQSFSPLPPPLKPTLCFSNKTILSLKSFSHTQGWQIHPQSC